MLDARCEMLGESVRCGLQYVGVRRVTVLILRLAGYVVCRVCCACEQHVCESVRSLRDRFRFRCRLTYTHTHERTRTRFDDISPLLLVLLLRRPTPQPHNASPPTSSSSHTHTSRSRTRRFDVNMLSACCHARAPCSPDFERVRHTFAHVRAHAVLRRRRPLS